MRNRIIALATFLVLSVTSSADPKSGVDVSSWEWIDPKTLDEVIDEAPASRAPIVTEIGARCRILGAYSPAQYTKLLKKFENRKVRLHGLSTPNVPMGEDFEFGLSMPSSVVVKKSFEFKMERILDSDQIEARVTFEKLVFVVRGSPSERLIFVVEGRTGMANLVMITFSAQAD